MPRHIHPEDWRWSADTYYTPHHSISVIEAKDTPEPPENAHKVPFGFARVLVPEPTPAEPILWEGDGA